MATWTLQDIIQKVRNITGTPSADQLNDPTITDYINKYYQYTFPFEIKEQINLLPYNFQVFPNVPTYPALGTFYTDEPYAYCDGFPLIFYQDRDVFFQDWPQQYAQDQVATGNNVLTTFTGGTQNYPIQQGTYFITDGVQVVSDGGSSIQNQLIANGNGGNTYSGTLTSFPLQPGTFEVNDTIEYFLDNGLGGLVGNDGGMGTINYTTGAWTLDFNAAVADGLPIVASYTLVAGMGILAGNGTGTLNYITGAFSVTFTTAPAASATIYDKYIAYEPGRPQGVLWYANQFQFAPIPGQVHQITMQGYISQIGLTENQTPLQPEWGYLLAYGAALDIFQDRGDLVAYNNNIPMLKRYENVALGRTVQQYESQQSIPRF